MSSTALSSSSIVLFIVSTFLVGMIVQPEYKIVGRMSIAAVLILLLIIGVSLTILRILLLFSLKNHRPYKNHNE